MSLYNSSTITENKKLDWLKAVLERQKNVIICVTLESKHIRITVSQLRCSYLKSAIESLEN